jgi:hypothetical protein
LVAEPCGDAARCGWDDRELGFRCVARYEDPCLGIDSAGACRDGVAARCDGGKLALHSCGCGMECRIDGKTGGPVCDVPSESLE